MSDDFGTVSVRRGDRSRELEVLRHQREGLVKMLGEVDQAIRELELVTGAESPASRPLVTTNTYDEPTTAQPGGGMRVIAILAAAVVALALIAWLIWRASSDRGEATGTVVEETTAAETTTTAPATITESVPEALTIVPPSQDYGLVRKGTRATRQYEITNNTEEPISIALARSACRCLYYEHAPVVPPKGKESITVTIDGARAEVGTLRESVRVSSKADPAVGTSLDVIATVQ
jgi:hypothetical protein